MRPTIGSTEDGDRALRERGLIDFVTRAVNALPLLRAGALTWLASAESADPEWAQRFGVRTCSLEHQQGSRRDVRRCGIKAMKASLTPPARVRAHGQPPLLSATRPEVPRHWASLVAREPERAAPADLNDKTRMRAWFADRGLPVPVGEVVAAQSLSHPALVRGLGSPFVAQRPVGSGGLGTYLVRTDAELRAARAREPAAGDWLISEFLDGTALNFHGFVGMDGSVGVTRPSVQFAGLPEAGFEFGAYCGCDFQAPQRVSAIAMERAREAVERVGAGLAGRGYRGVFGVDLIVRGDSVAVLELNARPQSATWLLGEIERSQGHVPLLNRHALERQGRRTSGEHDPAPAPGVQLAVRHTGRTAVVTTAPRSGVYALDGDRLVWRRAGAGLLECAEGECAAVGLPTPGAELETGASLGMLVTASAATGPDGKVLNEHGARLTAAFRELFALSARETEEAAG